MTLCKPGRGATRRAGGIYLYEASSVSAAADNTGSALGITNLSAEQERRSREAEEAKRRAAVAAAEHPDAKLDVWLETVGAAALGGGGVASAVTGAVGFVVGAGTTCTGSNCHLTRR